LLPNGNAEDNINVETYINYTPCSDSRGEAIGGFAFLFFVEELLNLFNIYVIIVSIYIRGVF